MAAVAAEVALKTVNGVHVGLTMKAVMAMKVAAAKVTAAAIPVAAVAARMTAAIHRGGATRTSTSCASPPSYKSR